MKIEGGDVQLLINGKPVATCEDVSFTEKAQPRMPFGDFKVSFDFTIDDGGALWESILSALEPQTRYWRRRRAHVVKRWRQRVARKFSVPYQAFRRFCRTGAAQ